MELLRVEELRAEIDGKLILDNINFSLKKGSIVAIMGPNGSGKSTLARCILNDKKIKKAGKIIFKEKNLLELKTEEIAKLGIYVSMQFQPEIEYVKTRTFLKYLGVKDFDEIKNFASELNLPKDFLDRGINKRFSGGERKKFELLLIKILNPELIVFDEIDSGLDISSLEFLNDFIQKEAKNGKTFLIISHYTRIFKNIVPEKVIILKNGTIYKEGNAELLKLIDKHGYNI